MPGCVIIFTSRESDSRVAVIQGTATEPLLHSQETLVSEESTPPDRCHLDSPSSAPTATPSKYLSAHRQ